MIKMMRNSAHQTGFTLVEMIVVIVITGIIGGMVAIFIKAPVQGYMDSARRAEMTDIADTALRRISRDLRLALPNSVKVNGACTGAAACYLDFLSTTGGGRYRAAAPGSNVLDFASAPVVANPTTFDVLGPVVQVQANDQLVIYNLGICTNPPTCSAVCSTLGADAYEGCNRRTITAGGNTIIFTSTGRPFPFESPSQRFQVVHEQVRYICNPTTGNLTRYWWAANSIVAPSATVPSGAGVSIALLATNVSACSFVYDANVVAQRSGLVTMNLSITETNPSGGNETVTLYSATHVSNVP